MASTSLKFVVVEDSIPRYTIVFRAFERLQDAVCHIIEKGELTDSEYLSALTTDDLDLNTYMIVATTSGCTYSLAMVDNWTTDLDYRVKRISFSKVSFSDETLVPKARRAFDNSGYNSDSLDQRSKSDISEDDSNEDEEEEEEDDSSSFDSSNEAETLAPTLWVNYQVPFCVWAVGVHLVLLWVATLPLHSYYVVS